MIDAVFVMAIAVVFAVVLAVRLSRRQQQKQKATTDGKANNNKLCKVLCSISERQQASHGGKINMSKRGTITAEGTAVEGHEHKVTPSQDPEVCARNNKIAGLVQEARTTIFAHPGLSDLCTVEPLKTVKHIGKKEKSQTS